MARRSFPWIALAAAGVTLGVAGVASSLAGRFDSVQQSVSRRRVALIGDSYAVGLGPELAKLVPNFMSAGRVSTRTDQWAAWLPGWLTTYQPTITLVALGVNDGNAPNQANYHAIVSTLHGIGSKVIWIEPPAGVNNQAVRNVIASLGVSTVPATKVALRPDEVHPVSYAPWAKEIARSVS